MFFIVFFSLFLIFISGLRDRFADTTDYRMMYDEVVRTGIMSDDLKGVEKGYLLFTKILSLITPESQILFIVSAIIIISANTAIITKYSEDIPYSLLLYFLLSFISTMNGMRQLIAVALSLLFFPLIVKGKTIPYIILVVVLMTIHRSAIVLIPIYFIVRNGYFNKWIIGIITLSAMTFILPNELITRIMNFVGNSMSLLDRYEGMLTYSMGMSMLRFAVCTVPIAMIVYYRYKCPGGHKSKTEDIMMNLCIISFCFELLALKNLFFARISMYWSVFPIILMPMLIKELFVISDRKAVKAISIALYIIYFIFQIDAYGGMDNFKLVI